MDQKDGHGHHAITHAAVEELFTGLPEDGTIRGMTRDEYEAALDAGQEHQDRWYGPTTHPAWADPDAQREHGMADPNRSGEENRVIDREYVEDEVAAARGDNAMEHLGNAAHALEDSYSEAHAFRGDSANSGDPTAPIESFNVFDPLPNPAMGTWGKFGDEQGTHDERFDEVPVDTDGNLVRGTDVAGAHAVAGMLRAYEDNVGRPDAEANANVDAVIDQFYRAPEDGETDVNTAATDEWRAERDERLEVHEREEEGRELTEQPGFFDGVIETVTTEAAAAVAWGGEVVDDVATGAGRVEDWAVEQGTAVGEWAGEQAEAAGTAVSETVDEGVEAVEELFEDVF